MILQWSEVPQTTFRRVGAEAERAWDGARRAMYLLRDGAAPLSADLEVSAPCAAGSADCVEMKLIVATLSAELEAALRVDVPPQLTLAAEGWVALGHDVCDGAMRSGLMNCAYPRDERDDLALRWAPKLNRFHLIREYADADAFRHECDRRDSARAPFFVVAIFTRPAPAVDAIPALLPHEVEPPLQAFLGSAALDAVAPLILDPPARSLFELRAGANHYLLQVSDPGFDATAWTDALRYAQLAADAGAAPELRLVLPEQGALLTDWTAGPSDVPLASIARSLALLHRSPAFPLGVNLYDWLDDRHHQLLDELPHGMVRSAVLEWRPLRASCTRHEHHAACHQRLAPDRIRAGAADRAWFIDWTWAGRGDPLYDVASVANWFAPDDAATRDLLRAYLDREPRPHELAQIGSLRAVHLLVMLCASLEHAGLLATDRTPELRWATLLRQPARARGSERIAIAQRQATLAREVVSWRQWAS